MWNALRQQSPSPTNGGDGASAGTRASPRPRLPPSQAASADAGSPSLTMRSVAMPPTLASSGGVLDIGVSRMATSSTSSRGSTHERTSQLMDMLDRENSDHHDFRNSGSLPTEDDENNDEQKVSLDELLNAPSEDVLDLDNDDEDDEPPDYVPEGLRGFLQQAQQTLHKTQATFLQQHDTMSPLLNESMEETVTSPPHDTNMAEDAHDRALKGQLLSKFDHPQRAGSCRDSGSDKTNGHGTTNSGAAAVKNLDVSLSAQSNASLRSAGSKNSKTSQSSAGSSSNHKKTMGGARKPPILDTNMHVNDEDDTAALAINQRDLMQLVSSAITYDDTDRYSGPPTPSVVATPKFANLSLAIEEEVTFDNDQDLSSEAARMPPSPPNRSQTRYSGPPESPMRQASPGPPASEVSFVGDVVEEEPDETEQKQRQPNVTPQPGLEKTSGTPARTSPAIASLRVSAYAKTSSRPTTAAPSVRTAPPVKASPTSNAAQQGPVSSSRQSTPRSSKRLAPSHNIARSSPLTPRNDGSTVTTTTNTYMMASPLLSPVPAVASPKAAMSLSHFPKKPTTPVSGTSRLLQGTAASAARSSPVRSETRSSPTLSTAAASPTHITQRVTPAAATAVASRLSKATAASTARQLAVQGVSPNTAAKATPPSNKSPAKKMDSVSSRLTKATAASQARKVSASEAPNLTMDNSGRESSPTHSAAAWSPATAHDKDSALPGVARLMQPTAASQARRTSTDALGDAGSVASRSVVSRAPSLATAASSRPTISHAAVDGIAKARERVRQRQLEQKKRQERESALRSMRRISTVPTTPRFATTAKLGAPPAKPAAADEMSLASSTKAYEQGLRSDSSTAAVSAVSSARPGRPPLTIPQGPRLSTGTRRRSVAPLPQVLRRGDSTGLSRPTGSKKQFTLAQSTDVLANALRQEEPLSVPRVHRDGQLTIPVTPKFSSRTRTKEPLKSTEEKEVELMEYYRSHPFKANPVAGSARSQQRRPGEVPAVKITKAAEARAAAAAAQRQVSVDRPRAPPAPSSRRSLTNPLPFDLTTSRRLSQSAPDTRDETDDEARAYVFKAKPPPATTYRPAASLHATGISKPAASISSHESSFQLSTTERAARRNATAEASRQRAERLMKEREAQARLRREQRHKAEMAKAKEHAKNAVVAPAKPFSLQSVLRHEAYQKEFEDKLKQAAEEQKKKNSFRARLFANPPPPEKIKSPREHTAAEPFQLSSVGRHEKYDEKRRLALQAEEEELRQRAAFKAKPVPPSVYKATSPTDITGHRNAVLQRYEERRRRLQNEEEELRQQANFKANPVPKSTYHYKPVSTKPAPLVDPFSPQLQSKHRATERRAFDEQAAETRAAEEAERKVREALRAAEDEADLQERRRLPAKEGGMMFKAEPVNAVLQRMTETRWI